MIDIKSIERKSQGITRQIDYQVRISSEEPLVLGEVNIDVPYGQTLAFKMSTSIKLPDGQTQGARLYNISSNCLVGTTSKLAPIFNGNLEPVPFEFNPETGYSLYSPGSWLVQTELEGAGWSEIEKFIVSIINPEVKQDQIRAILHNRIPDHKINARWQGGNLLITVDERVIGILGLIQLAVQGELLLTASIVQGR